MGGLILGSILACGIISGADAISRVIEVWEWD